MTPETATTAPPLEPSRLDNALGRETSPYLLQHRNNPVHWQPWSAETLALAERLDKPILLSVGYAACHWCHVMAHESFEDESIAALMNALFVNIKVDREERPDIDAIYQTALALTGQQGGWPLTMFLTPAGEPFWGGTYFPPESRYGRAGFPGLLRRIHDVYRTDPDAVRKNAAALIEALDKMGRTAPGEAPPLDTAFLDGAAERLAREVDPVHGGIGGAPKFPHTGALELVWRGYLRTGQTALRQAVTLSLDRMCQGGIYDHLGGGWARYSTDERWLVPHFEKMLYDNAQLVDLLTTVWQKTENPLYRTRVAETVAWVRREMTAEGNGFASSLDADSEGEEGRFYVWTEAEIDRLLGADANRFKAAYDVSTAGNWDGKTVLNRSRAPDLGATDDEAALARMRSTLWQAREHRVRPAWDDKVLADWNGLMIAALARAALAFDEPDWLETATAAFHFVAETMTSNGRLLHAARAGRARHAALLDDYANMARAAIALYEATGEARLIDRARRWVAVLDAHYWDRRDGGYFYTADDAETLIARPRTAADSALPAGNGTMVEVLARLYLLTGDTAYRRRADTLIEAFAPEFGRSFSALAALLNGLDTLLGGLQAVIIGRAGAADRRALLDAANTVSAPGRTVLLAEPDGALPTHHPARGKGMIDGRAVAYVCRDMTCSLPITEPEALAAALETG